MRKVVTKELEFAGKKITLETGKWVNMATRAVVARMGETTVMAVLVASHGESTLDYFPLTVEYLEKLYAGGIIRGSRWMKRETQSGDETILTGRVIDRSIRPLFPKEYKHEVQVVVTLLSYDGENEPDILGTVAASAAIAASPVPWKGPIGCVRMGYINGEYVVNPSKKQLVNSDLDLIVSQTEEKTVMLEAGAKQVSNEIMLGAIEKAHEENKKLISLINDFAKEVGDEKVVIEQHPDVMKYVEKIEAKYLDVIKRLIQEKIDSDGKLGDHEANIDVMWADFKQEDPELSRDTVSKASQKVFHRQIRKIILETQKHVDGRNNDEVREINVNVDVLPRVHGSATFARGNTQILSVVTLGPLTDEQLIETIGGEEKKRYIHHYNFPPYSTGDVGRISRLSRREIGHGALAERALEPVIPSADVFPYTIRVVSETLGSQGSTSMASSCGSALALMAAGVPIIEPVAGIAVGRVQESDDNYLLLTDILGLEDAFGDMDFKVAGTKNGITAIQLDVKDGGLDAKQIGEVFDRAQTARLFILGKMLAVIAEPRKTLSPYAPKIGMVKVPVEQIGEIIGPSGRTIKGIMAKTNTQLDMQDDGTLSITATNDEDLKAAMDIVEGMTRVVTAGEVFDDAEVKRILPFGAFVEFLPGQEGMVHVSQMSTQYINNPEEVVHIGDKVKVRVLEVDQQGRINLSMLFGDDAKPVEKRERPEGEGRFTPRNDRGGRDFNRGGSRGGNRYDRGGDRGGRERSDHPLSQQLRKQGGQSRGFGKNDNRY